MHQRIVLLLVLVLVGCGREGTRAPDQKDSDELTKEYGPQLEARIAKLVAARAAAEASRAELGAPGDAKLALDFVFHQEALRPNVIVAQAEDLEDAKQPRTWDHDPYKPPMLLITVVREDDNPVYLAKALLGVEKGAVAAQFEPAYAALLAAKYALVVFTNDVTPGYPAGDEFHPWKGTATAVLVDIDAAKPLGGFTFAAANAAEVETTTNLRTGESNAMDKLQGDFLAQARKSFEAGIEARWPGARLEARAAKLE